MHRDVAGPSEVSGNSVPDGGMVTVDDAADFREAVVAFGMVADHPPQLVARGGDSSGTVVAAYLVAGDASPSADVVGKGEKAADGKGGDDSVGVEGGCRAHAMSFGWREARRFRFRCPCSTVGGR